MIIRLTADETLTEIDFPILGQAPNPLQNPLAEKIEYHLVDVSSHLIEGVKKLNKSVQNFSFSDWILRASSAAPVNRLASTAPKVVAFLSAQALSTWSQMTDNLSDWLSHQGIVSLYVIDADTKGPMLFTAEHLEAYGVEGLIPEGLDFERLELRLREIENSVTLRDQCQKFQELSLTDAVTQVPNHRYFQQQLEFEVKKSRSTHKAMALLMIDVDHFKSFNDHYGHPEGDKLLSAIAAFVSSEVRVGDSLARYGGEEFALILPDTDLSIAQERAEQLRRKIENHVFMGPFERPAHVTVSIGISGYPQHGETSSLLVASADRALYQAKRQGRNQVMMAGT